MSRMDQGEITYGLVSDDDISAATGIYLQNFPHIAKKCFVNLEHARFFYHDLIELMRWTYPETFFTAYFNRTLAGYLILTYPEKRLIPTLLTRGFLLKVIRRVLSGSYGSSTTFYKKVIKELFIPANIQSDYSLRAFPHVYILAVDQQFVGRGIGSELIQRALDFCAQSYRKIWLYVDEDNTGAVRFYTRFGFKISHSSNKQHLMTFDLVPINTKFET